MGKQESSKNFFPKAPRYYKIIKLICRGTDSSLFKAFCLQKKTVVAIKVITLHPYRQDFVPNMEEIKAQYNSVLSHSNILNVHTSFFINSECKVLWVVMPFMSAGSLLSIVSSSFPTGLSEQYIADILKQTLNLMSYIHLYGVLLKDFTLGNIFLDHNNGALIKFGNVCYPPSRSPRIPEDISGNPSYWVSPEVINLNSGYNEKSEIWSLGILALELAHGKPPISDVHMAMSLTKKMKKRLFSANLGECSYCFGKKRTFSESFKDLVKQCLEEYPGNRPTVDTLGRHGFFSRCKFPGYLLRDLLKDLPNVNDRNKFSMAAEEKEKDSEETEDGWRSQSGISGWKLDVENLELLPTFSNDSDRVMETGTETGLKRKRLQVKLGGEKMIEDDEVMMEIDMGMVEEQDEEELEMEMEMDTGTVEEEEVELEKKAPNKEGKEKKGKEKKGIENEMWNEISSYFFDIAQELDDVGIDLDDVSENTTKDEILVKLFSAKCCLEKQVDKIKFLIELHGGVSD